MKRIALIVLVILVVVAVAAGALIATALMGRQSIVDGSEVNGIRIVADGITSLAVIPVGEGRVALIDAGNDKAGRAILAELSRRHVGPDAVAAVFLTHGHGDHRGAVRLFPKAEVMALEAEVPVIEGRESGGGPLNRLMGASPSGIKVTRQLQDGETATVGDKTFRVYAVPGHTPGSAAYLVERVLFMGDAADASSDGRVMRSAWVFSKSQAEDQASLIGLSRRLAQENADVTAIVFAHSGTLNKGLAPLAEFATKNGTP
jgi:glyoxylase-like metal-dependent hydrolase (beta-lactamase superfamily II)